MEFPAPKTLSLPIREFKKNPWGAYSKKYTGEFEKGIFLYDMREKKCLSNGLMGIWEVGHGRVSRGVLKTEHGLQKKEKERESGGWTGIKRL